MISFLVGILVAAVASAPAILLMAGGKEGETRQRLKLWAIGTGLRFGIIGAALYYLFTQTSLDRIPVVIGVAVGYFVLFLIEIKKTLRF